MFTICARIDSKKSDGNFGSNAVGIIVTAEHLELKSPAEVAAKADELFRMAREAVDRQVGGDSDANPPTSQPAPSTNGNGKVQGNGHSNGNGTKSYGRPKEGSEPTPKQRSFLHKIAKDRNLGPQTIADICRRIVGKDPRNLDKHDMSKLIEGLLAETTAVA
jgi:hypothetical protein